MDSRIDFGWFPDAGATDRLLASLPHAGELADAAPHWMGDGLTGDLMPYLAFYAAEIRNPDGSIWKAVGAEPPYIPQVGNNCTSRGLADGVDLLQCMDAVDPAPGATAVDVVHRVCVEATYAFGLDKGGYRGDGGCSGAGMAHGASEVGLVPYSGVKAPWEETRSRLLQWANDPAGVVAAFAEKAAPFKVTIARCTTWAEYCAALANRKIVTLASDVGFESPRDARGICERRGTWDHQMFGGGVIRSDGIETAVIFQSWGPGNPNGLGRNRAYIDGDRPFKLPSFAFRARREAVEEQLDQGDSYAIGLFPGFERRPLPAAWTWDGFA